MKSTTRQQKTIQRNLWEDGTGPARGGTIYDDSSIGGLFDCTHEAEETRARLNAVNAPVVQVDIFAVLEGGAK